MKFFGSLRDYQEAAVTAAVNSPEKGFAYFMDLGTGKTRCGLAYVVRTASRAPTLIITPRAVIPSWEAEIEKVTDGTFISLEGDKKRRIKLLRQKADFYIINPEGLNTMQEELLGKHFGLVVLDESHRFANRTTHQSKIAHKLCDRGERVLLLTGTPVRTDARDYWSQIFAIDRGKRLGEKYYAFTSANFRNVSRTRIPIYVPLPGSEERIRESLEDVVYRVKKEDVLKELPPKVYHMRHVTMTDRQIEAYVSMAEDLIVELKAGEDATGTIASSRTILTKYLRLHQIAQGFLYDDDKKVSETFEPNPKTKLLLDILGDHDGKAIVWCVYRHTIKDLQFLLAEEGYNPVSLWGDTKDAGAVVKAFQEDPDVRVLIGQPQSGGEGVTLTAADMAIYYTNTWSWPQRIQSEDRCNRIGSEIHDSINIFDIVAKGSIDAKIIAALHKKKDTSEILTDFKSHLLEISQTRAA